MKWGVNKLRRSGGRLELQWTAMSSSKPAPDNGSNWEPVFHPALSGSFLYVPGGAGMILKLDRQSGYLIASIQPFGENDPNRFVTSPLTVDNEGFIYYTVMKLDAAEPWSKDVLEAWLVKIDAAGQARKVSFAALVSSAPVSGCVTNFVNEALPFPRGSTTLPEPPRPREAFLSLPLPINPYNPATEALALPSISRRSGLSGLIRWCTLAARIFLTREIQMASIPSACVSVKRCSRFQTSIWLVAELLSPFPRFPAWWLLLASAGKVCPSVICLGKSNGFRRPGYAISADPGFLYTRWGYVFGCNVPWAIERNLRRSVAEIANGFRSGDAAFADYAVTLGLSRRF